MPQEIVFEELPTGYAENSARGGQKITVRLSDFVSSEDGDELVAKLEGLPQQLLSMLHLPPPGVLPSMINSLLAIIRKDKTATVYVNEAQALGLMRVKCACKAGEVVTVNQILDIGKMRFADITIPADAGIVYVFSVGWRKGLFYDLAPLHDAQGRVRSYDLEETLGSLYAYLLFQERFKPELLALMVAMRPH